MLRSIRILLLAWLSIGVAAAAAPRERTLLVFGDSLSAAYGLRTEEGWVPLLQKRLQDEGYVYRVVNASVSGETTAGGRARLVRALDTHKPDLVLLELGANDGLRGLPVKSARDNLAAMMQEIQGRKARLLLAGILMPPNYGLRYATDFAGMYTGLAEEFRTPLIPFFLQGIALDQRYVLEDLIHPNAAGQRILLETVWTHIQPLLER